jgi:hypothetical protein
MNNKLHLTLNHTGKMYGIQSLSTACTLNSRCAKYSKINGAICQKCFAAAMFKRYGAGFNNAFENNYKLLTREIIPAEDLPIITGAYFRFEAFGDLENEIQFVNYLNICEKNPLVNFAIWTKNPDIMQAVFNQGYKKPENLNIIISSLFINKQRSAAGYNFVDKIFTVYDKKTAAARDININCGARSCLGCLKCYTKNDITIINELVK